jgi:t-SNARE complex subunit (syntaxin)
MDQRFEDLQRGIVEAKKAADKVNDKADRQHSELTARVTTLEVAIAAKANQGQGITHSWGIVVVVIGLIATVVTIVTAVSVFFK